MRLTGAVFLAGLGVGSCVGAQTAAEASYGGALLRCVDKATTLAESKACRAAVDARWGITQTVAEGGVP